MPSDERSAHDGCPSVSGGSVFAGRNRCAATGQVAGNHDDSERWHRNESTVSALGLDDSGEDSARVDRCCDTIQPGVY